MTLPEVSLAQVNRFLLRKQHLLAPCDDPLTAARDACGLQAQVPSSPALSLRARVRGFTRADYDRLIMTERSLVRSWALRGTVHVVPSERLAEYTRVYLHEPWGYEPGLAGWPAERVAQTLRLLAERPQTRQQLLERAVAELGVPEAEARRLYGPWGGLLRTLAMAGQTVHVPAEGADVPLARTVDWLGQEPGAGASVEALEDALLHDYLAGYGPATVRDFAYFTLFKTERIRRILQRAEASLAEVRVEGSKLPHYLLAEDLPALLATSGSETAPVRLLPRFDSLLLAYKDKARLLDEADRPKVFRIAAQVEATVLVNGRVVGTWRFKQTTKSLRFTYSPFRKRGAAASAVEREARRLADWFGLDDMTFDLLA